MRTFPTLACLLFPIAALAADRDPAPVARLIDEEIGKRLEASKVPASGPASDAQFLRRVCLDITGRLPTRQRAAAFLDSTAPDKRARLIDELLANPTYGQHFATLWVNLIIANGDPPRSSRPAFHQWLADQLNQGRGWDRIVRAMLTADGPPGESPESWYISANIGEPGQLAAATTRLFLGVQTQCAECHDHPFTRWTQDDYWGFAAFFGRVRQVTVKGGKQLSEEPVPNKKPAPGTGAVIMIPTGSGHKSAGKLVKARFLGGDAPELPDEGPLRPRLADWATAADNPYFAPAAVNRLWAHFFGSGFVNPVDDFQEGLDPSHPELLAALAGEFRDSGHDLKHLIRCICTSAAYQRTSQPLPGNQDDTTRFSRMAVKVMMPHVMHDSLVTALGVTQLPGGMGMPIPYEVYAGKPSSGGRPSGREEFIKFFDTADDSGRTTEFTHGIPQLLALMNADQFNKVSPVVEELVKARLTPEAAVEQLYLATLSRRPTPAETRLMTDYLARRSDLRQGYAGVLWILFNSGEFVLNH